MSFDRSNSNQVIDMTARMSGFTNDLYKVINTKNSQRSFGY